MNDNRWIKVSDRWPEDELQTVLVLVPDGEHYDMYVCWPGIYEDEPNYWLLAGPFEAPMGDVRIEGATHWMPLPTPPAA